MQQLGPAEASWTLSARQGWPVLALAKPACSGRVAELAMAVWIAGPARAGRRWLVAEVQVQRKRRWQSSWKAGLSRYGYSPTQMLSWGSQASLRAAMREKSGRSLSTRQRTTMPRRIF